MRSGGRLRRTIKEAIDDLPNGICVFDSTGLMVLCNHTMYQLGFLLAGRDIQTLSEMRKTLKELPRNSTARKDGNLFILSDGRAWQFSECKVEDSYGESFIQFIAADVTELYIKRLELEEGNRILEEYGYRLRRLSANIQAATREEEILDTKMRVHDNIGRGIIAARQYLLSGRPMAEFDMSVWEDALQILKYDVENTPDKTALEQFMDSAKAIGIRVHIMGRLPENTKMGALMIIALRECANNAVRHSLINRDIECWEDSWSQIYDADILQFAALAFLFCALIRFLKMKPWQGLTAGIIISLIGMGLNNTITDLENPMLQAVTGLFWGTHEGSYFPFTSWIVFVAAGYVFADILQCTKNKKKMYLCISPISGILFLIIAKILTFSHEWDAMMDGEYYYHQDIMMNIMYVAFVLAWLGICYFISTILPKLMSDVLKKFSTNVTVIYVMQYILIIYIQVLITGETVFSAPIILGITVLYTVIAYYGAIAYKDIKLKSNHAGGRRANLECVATISN